MLTLESKVTTEVKASPSASPPGGGNEAGSAAEVWKIGAPEQNRLTLVVKACLSVRLNGSTPVAVSWTSVRASVTVVPFLLLTSSDAEAKVIPAGAGIRKQPGRVLTTTTTPLGSEKSYSVLPELRPAAFALERGISVLTSTLSPRSSLVTRPDC